MLTNQPSTVAVVRVTRRYRSARTGELVDALSDAGWAELLARLDGYAPLAVTPYGDDRGEGVDVTVATQRGPGGAYSVHDLACRYGALAVVR